MSREIDNKILEQAIEKTIVEFPNSFISDMMQDFPVEMIVRFIMIYSGQVIKVPSVKSIWTRYRNEIIYDSLTKENSNIVRKYLSGYFGISVKKVTNIFSYVKKKKEEEKTKNKEDDTKNKSLEISTTRLFNRHISDAISDTKEVLKRKRS